MIKSFKIKTNCKGCGYKYNRAYVKKNHAKFIPLVKVLTYQNGMTNIGISIKNQ